MRTEDSLVTRRPDERKLRIKAKDGGGLEWDSGGERKELNEYIAAQVPPCAVTAASTP